MEHEICIGAAKVSSMLFKDSKRTVSDEDCLNFRGWSAEADFEESVFQIEKIATTGRESSNYLYCKECVAKRIGSLLQDLNSKKNEVARLRDSIEKRVSLKRDLLNKKLNLLSLKILQQKKTTIKNNFAQKTDNFQVNISLVSSYRDELIREHKRLEEQIPIIESELLWKKQKLSELICKRSLEYYTLFENSSCFPDYSVNQKLQFYTYENVTGEDETKNEIRIRFKTFYFQNDLSQEDRLISSYSVMNLVQFLTALFKLTKTDVPFPIQLNKQGQLIINNQDIYLSQPHSKQKKQQAYHYVDVELLIYFWINYRALYKRLQIDFDELVLEQGLFFPVQQLKKYFELQLDSPNKQAPLTWQINDSPIKMNNSSGNSKQHNNIPQKFESELLNIKYPKNSLSGQKPTLSLQASLQQSSSNHSQAEEEPSIVDKKGKQVRILEFDEDTQEFVNIDDEQEIDEELDNYENEISQILVVNAP